MSYRSSPDERVYFQVHGLPSVLKLKIAADSPLHHLFDHIPAKKYQPALCIDGPEFVWRDVVLDPLMTPEHYRMEPGERNVHTIVVNYPLVSPREALLAQRGTVVTEDSGNFDSHDTPHQGGGMSSARLSIEGDLRSPFPSARTAGEMMSPNAAGTPGGGAKGSPRVGHAAISNLPSVDKIIDDLTQALRGAEDEIEDLQGRLDEKSKKLDALDPKKVAALEEENARLKTELEAERKENDSKQEAIQILRNKISVLENRIAENAAAQPTGSQSPSPTPSVVTAGAAAADALATSLRHHCHSLEEELSHREEEIRQLNQKIETLTFQLTDTRESVEEEAKRHKEALDKLDATRVALSKKDELAHSSADDLKLRIDRLERENAILQADNTTLAQRVIAVETYKAELRGTKNQHDIDTAAWNAQKAAYEKEIKSLREKLAEHLLQSQRHEKVLADRNASLQEKIAFFEDPRSVTQREEEYQQREIEMRSRLRDALAENDRLKTIHKDLKRQVSELETALFECNNVLVRVQKENTDLKKAGISGTLVSNGVTPRLPASARTPSATPNPIGSPLQTAPIGSAAAVASSKAAENALLHVDPFSIMKGNASAERARSSPNVADTLLLSRHGSTQPLAFADATDSARVASGSQAFHDA